MGTQRTALMDGRMCCSQVDDLQLVLWQAMGDLQHKLMCAVLPEWHEHLNNIFAVLR